MHTAGLLVGVVFAWYGVFFFFLPFVSECPLLWIVCYLMLVFFYSFIVNGWAGESMDGMGLVQSA